RRIDRKPAPRRPRPRTDNLWAPWPAPEFPVPPLLGLRLFWDRQKREYRFYFFRYNISWRHWRNHQRYPLPGPRLPDRRRTALFALLFVLGLRKAYKWFRLFPNGYRQRPLPVHGCPHWHIPLH